ncbi:MAG: STAS domain-containing protein [Acidimicrobiales bacterium]
MDEPISEGTPPVVHLRGEIDLAQAPQVQERLDRLADVGATTIVVDLLDATFLDSVALGVLVGALKRCRAAGGTLHLVVTEPRIVKVLRITGLLDEFSVHDSLAAATGALEGDAR